MGQKEQIKRTFFAYALGFRVMILKNVDGHNKIPKYGREGLKKM